MPLIILAAVGEKRGKSNPKKKKSTRGNPLAALGVGERRKEALGASMVLREETFGKESFGVSIQGGGRKKGGNLVEGK